MDTFLILLPVILPIASLLVMIAGFIQIFRRKFLVGIAMIVIGGAANLIVINLVPMYLLGKDNKGIGKPTSSENDARQRLESQYIEEAKKMTADDLYHWLMTASVSTTTDFNSIEESKLKIYFDEFEWRVGRDTSEKARSQENAVLDKYGPCPDKPAEYCLE